MTEEVYTLALARGPAMKVGMVPLARILWVKSVSLDEDEFAYPGRPGQRFDLHAAPEDGDSLGDPEVGDLLVLTQHEQATHLVRVVGERVEARPRRSMKRGTRDERFSVQRACEHVYVRPFEEAPGLEEAFGCDPQAKGGETFAIFDLPAIEASDQPAWMVRRRILVALEGPSMRARFEAKGQTRRDDLPALTLQDFLRKEE